MTRKEEIEQASRNFESIECTSPYINFIQGAEWADENPYERMIAKYLYEKKGYPIDLNGNIPSFDETMKDVEQYSKYKEDKFIEKACEWMSNHVNDYIINDKYILPNGKMSRDWLKVKSEMFDDFRKYMKGE